LYSLVILFTRNLIFGFRKVIMANLASRNLHRALNESQKKFSQFFSAATIKGPWDSPYLGGTFVVTLRSASRQVFHPNISEKGFVYLDMLKDNWSPSAHDSLENDPYPESAELHLTPRVQNYNMFDDNITQLYISDKTQYDLNARTWTRSFAME
ncbi:unnamed protein product, partial [Thlaspi arvense]